MKSPPKYSAGFTYLHVFDSIFKEFSDPTYPRSNVTKLCVLLSGGVSAITTAPLLIFTSTSGHTGALLTPTIGTAQVEYLPCQHLQTRFTSFCMVEIYHFQSEKTVCFLFFLGSIILKLNPVLSPLSVSTHPGTDLMISRFLPAPDIAASNSAKVRHEDLFPSINRFVIVRRFPPGKFSRVTSSIKVRMI